MNLTLKTRYWQDEKARQAFIAFVKEIHNADFTRWDAAGYWDDDYIPFSYFEGERLVASTCIYSMPCLVQGEWCKVAQVSSVGTLPEYRLQGLNRRLHKMALEDARSKHRFVFLFSDEDAIPFYRKLGFKSVDDFYPYTHLQGTTPKAGLIKLDLHDTKMLQGVYGLACRRAPVSAVFGNINPKLVMFHTLFSLHEHAYRIADLNTILFMKREEGKIILYDIIAEQMPPFERLYPYISSGSAEEIEYRFSPDLLHLPNIEFRQAQGNDAHVMGDFNLNPFVFPYTGKA
jgi:GNAT superfamily N-acetyltransferase